MIAKAEVEDEVDADEAAAAALAEAAAAAAAAVADPHDELEEDEEGDFGWVEEDIFDVPWTSGTPLMDEIQCKHPIGIADMTLRVYSISMSVSILLVGQCAVALVTHGWPGIPPCQEQVDNFETWFAQFLTCDERLPFLIMLFRVCVLFPRPYCWYHMLRWYADAKKELLPDRVALRLFQANDQFHFRLNDALSVGYNVYLFTAGARMLAGNSFAAPWITTAVSIFLAPSEWIYSLASLESGPLLEACPAGGGNGPGPLLEDMLFNFWLTISATIVQRAVSAFFMWSALNGADDTTRKRHREAVERHSVVMKVDEELRERCKDDVCCVCFAPLELDETARTLTRCGHAFHASCVDAWLLGSQPPAEGSEGDAMNGGGGGTSELGQLRSTCPMCQASVVDEPEDISSDIDEEDDSEEAEEARKLRWIARVRALDDFEQGF